MSPAADCNTTSCHSSLQTCAHIRKEKRTAGGLPPPPHRRPLQYPAIQEGSEITGIHDCTTEWPRLRHQHFPDVCWPRRRANPSQPPTILLLKHMPAYPPPRGSSATFSGYVCGGVQGGVHVTGRSLRILGRPPRDRLHVAADQRQWLNGVTKRGCDVSPTSPHLIPQPGSYPDSQEVFAATSTTDASIVSIAWALDP